MIKYLPPAIQAAILVGGFAIATGDALAQSDEEAPSFDPLPPPTLNFYGAPGLIDLPSGEASPDGQFTSTVSSFGGNTRVTLSYQFTPRISASFRYVGIQNWNSNGFETYYDRSFDVRFLLFKESRRWPAVTVGLQDFVGTGIYAAEYIAATKTFQTPGAGGYGLPGRLKVTAGLGWGRLGSAGSIGSPFGSDRPSFNPDTSLGGEPAYDSWFRGPAAPFAGIEWHPNDRWGLKLEYSSDAYNPETRQRNVFERKSRFNFGVEYQYSDRLRIGGYYLYGSEIGVMAQVQLNPKDPVTPLQVRAPEPILVRPSRRENPEAWDTAWVQSTAAPTAVRDALVPGLNEQGLLLESVSVQATSVELRVRNTRYLSTANAVGRAARVLANVMPPSVETFQIVPVQGGLALSTVTIRRSDLEALEFDPQAADALRAVMGVTDAGRRPADAVMGQDIYPEFNWSIGPYVQPSYFDPDNPVRFDLGIEASASYRFARGWTIGTRIRHSLAGNVSEGRLSNSVLPRVRTDGVLYARGSDTDLTQLYISKQWKPGRNVYARLTAGYLEAMFGGVSGEVLWKPANSRLALGVEANYVRQRDFDQGFGFRDYSVVTGHASAYYQFGGGYVGQIDVGRYLAGDVGATFTLDREFANGWRVGGFFTLTDVSSEEFGEGSFDKGIRLTIPVNWFIGKPSRQTISSTIRPIQRDGGARLAVPGRLYEQVREGHFKALDDQAVRIWE